DDRRREVGAVVEHRLDEALGEVVRRGDRVEKEDVLDFREAPPREGRPRAQRRSASRRHGLAGAWRLAVSFPRRSSSSASCRRLFATTSSFALARKAVLPSLPRSAAISFSTDAISLSRRARSSKESSFFGSA